MRYPYPGLAADGETEVHLSRESRATLQGPISTRQAETQETLGERVLRLARVATAMHRNEAALRLAEEWEKRAGHDFETGSCPMGSIPERPRGSLEDAS